MKSIVVTGTTYTLNEKLNEAIRDLTPELIVETKTVTVNNIITVIILCRNNIENDKEPDVRENDADK